MKKYRSVYITLSRFRSGSPAFCFAKTKQRRYKQVLRAGIQWGISSLLAAFGFFFFLGLSGCVNSSIKNIEARGYNIICFGDSITMGYGVDPGQDYPSFLARLVNLRVINAGIDGETSTEAIQRVETDVLNKDPLLVIVEFGGNDFLKKVPLEETLKNTENIVKKILASGAMVAIADVSANVVMENYRKGFKRLSKQYGTIFIPELLNGIITNPAFKSDFIHPNPAGYRVIAHRVYRAIFPYLNRNLILRRLKEEIPNLPK